MCRNDCMHLEKVPTNAFAMHPICEQRSLTGLRKEKGVAPSEVYDTAHETFLENALSPRCSCKTRDLG